LKRFKEKYKGTIFYLDFDKITFVWITKLSLDMWMGFL